MKHRFALRQQGISFFGLVILIIVLALIGLMVARVAPSVLEYRAIQGAVQKAKEDETPATARRTFDRVAEIEGIRSITSRDLEITKDDAGNLVIGFAYEREFHMGGPAYLLIKYAGRSD